MALHAVAVSQETGRESTLQHIGLLARKQERLREAQMDAEAQFLHSLAADYAAGGLDMADLADALCAYRAVAAPGFKNRWNAALPVSAPVVTAWAAWNAPNGPGGSWEGPYPVANSPAPARGVSVVYVLFDAANEPCYVGSTNAFRDRLARHHREGKRFVRWTAHPCADREAAYQLEERLLGEHQPYLNKKRGR